MSTEAVQVANRTFLVLLPETLLILSALVMMTAGAFVKVPRWVWSLISVGALLGSIVLLIAFRDSGTEAITYGAVALNDALSGYARMGFLITGLILFALAHDQVEDSRAPEFFGALLLVHAGAMLVASSNELVFLFVGLELVSIPTYLLLYLPRRTQTTQEAVTKYFYLSIFSSALLLFGLAYLYGIAGVSNLKALAFILPSISNGTPAAPPAVFGIIALVFVMAGLGFRVAAVPFHFYAPDVYQGSPTVIAAMLAWVPKGVGFLAMIRVLTAVLGDIAPWSDRAVLLAAIIAVATMVLGNTVALLQDDLKRLLAYSSIAHAGYLMLGIAVAFLDAGRTTNPYLGSQAIIFYLAAYSLMTLGAFGVLIALSTPERPVETVNDLAGLGRSRPVLSLALAICLFSLAGIPPLAGFWGKFQIFAAALGVNGPLTELFRYLAIIGVVNAAIGAYYYLRIVIAMYLKGPMGAPPAGRPTWPTKIAIATCAILSLLLGLYPDPINFAAREASLAATHLPDPKLIPLPATPTPPAIAQADTP